MEDEHDHLPYITNADDPPETPQSDQNNEHPQQTVYKRRSVQHNYDGKGILVQKVRRTFVVRPTTKNFIFFALTLFSFTTLLFAMGMAIYSALNDQCTDTYLALITLVLGIYTPQPTFALKPKKKSLTENV